MSMMKLVKIGAAAVATAALLAGCSTNQTPSQNSGPESASAPAKGDAPLEPQEASTDDMDLLPQAYKDSGVLKGATTDGMAPWSFLDPNSREVSGVDADILNEAAKRLGLEIEWEDIQFPAALPGVQAGRYDFYVSAMADRTDRQEVVNFIDYSYEGSGVIVPKGNPKGIDSFESLCGLRANYLSGSLFPDLVETLNSGACKDNPLQANESPDKQATYVAVASGQADVTFDTYGVSNYTFKTTGTGENLELELAPIAPFAPARQGIAFSKGNSDLQLAIAGAMQEMVEDGTYQKILDKWAVSDLALEKIMINSALSSAVTDFLE